MPPKRRKKTEMATGAAPGEAVAAAAPPPAALEPPLKKAKFQYKNDDSSSDEESDIQPVQAAGAGLPAAAPVPVDTRAVCNYGMSCYRNNPDHYRQFRHPPGHQKGDEYDAVHFAPANAVAVNSPAPFQQAQPRFAPQQQQQQQQVSSGNAGGVLSPAAEIYSKMLKSALSKNRVSVDEKKLLRTFRRDNGVTDHDHQALLRRFFWSADEWEDGEKQDDDVVLQEEKDKLEANRYGLVHITKEIAEREKGEKATVFAKVSHLFYSTMSQAQANYELAAVDVVCHPENRRKFEEARLDCATRSAKAGAGPTEHWGFHGTSRESIRKICETNFLMPDEITKLAEKAKAKAAPKKGGKGKGKAAAKSKMAKPVEILDEGYFGKGIYFTAYSDYALWYSDERDSDQVLLSRVLTGKEYVCNKRMDGKGLQKGFDSHVSPKGNEFVIFNAAQILPRYIITFREQEAKEREQES